MNNELSTLGKKTIEHNRRVRNVHTKENMQIVEDTIEEWIAMVKHAGAVPLDDERRLAKIVADGDTIEIRPEEDNIYYPLTRTKMMNAIADYCLTNDICKNCFQVECDDLIADVILQHALFGEARYG